MEAQAMVYNFAVAPQLASPRIFQATGWQTELYTLGGNSSDFHYGTLFLDGNLTYRLTGNINDTAVLLAQWAGSLPGVKAYTPPKSYDFAYFEIAKDGSFEVILSATEVKGKYWIKLDPAARYQWILFRPMMGGWDKKPADMKIERISDIDLNAYRQKETAPAAVAERIDFAADYLQFLVDQWNIDYYPRMRANAGGENKLATLTLDTAGDVGSPAAQYMQGVFVIDDGEALVVEMDNPRGAFWTIQLFDSWLKSIDFRTRQSSLNMDQVARDPDGKYRFVVSKRDPGIANWLDTGGVERGMLLVRNYRTQKLADAPKVTRVKFDELDKYISKDVARVTAEQRKDEIRKREAAYIQRLGE